MLSVNKKGFEVVEEALKRLDRLDIGKKVLDNGSTVIDFGVDSAGGLEAGVYLAKACMGGLGEVSLRTGEIDGATIPFVDVYTDHPAISLLGAQEAGWQISTGDYFAMGSGPARALSLKSKETFEAIDYEDDFAKAVIVLEADSLPGEEVLNEIAEECGVDPGETYALVAPTSCLAGSVQIASRIVETTVYRLNEIGYDTTKIVSGTGTAPVPPVKPDSTEAMGTTNDAQIYFGSTFLTAEEDNILEYVEKVPSSNSKDYGKPFFQTFKEADFDFYKIDPGIFAPAKVTVNVESSGEVVSAGELNKKVVKESFGLQ